MHLTAGICNPHMLHLDARGKKIPVVLSFLTVGSEPTKNTSSRQNLWCDWKGAGKGAKEDCHARLAMFAVVFLMLFGDFFAPQKIWQLDGWTRCFSTFKLS